MLATQVDEMPPPDLRVMHATEAEKCDRLHATFEQMVEREPNDRPIVHHDLRDAGNGDLFQHVHDGHAEPGQVAADAGQMDPCQHPDACNFLFGDGSVRAMSVSTPRSVLLKLADVNDGSAVEIP